MARKNSRSEYGARFHRKQIIRTVAIVVIGVVLVCGIVFFFTGWRSRLGDEKKELLQYWEEGDYNRAFALSGEKLEAKPMDYFLLTIHGFASYQLAVAQINTFDTLTYIDESIWSLRKALLSKEGADDPRVHYVLGKAYYYKGRGYADLSVAYLEEARLASYTAGDIPEYLGLAYAEIQDYHNSVAAFSLALTDQGGEGPSDLLLLSIAHSYMALGESEAAMAYLIRCVDTSRDSTSTVAARLLLGDILGQAGDRAGAEAQYLTIIEEDGENAEAYFRLGELYAGTGDTTRARAEWRRAVRIDPAHIGARERLGM
jgi:tetratricopeptide (TPR) repeat protein